MNQKPLGIVKGIVKGRHKAKVFGIEKKVFNIHFAILFNDVATIVILNVLEFPKADIIKR